MNGNRHAPRDERGRFKAAPRAGTELKRARGDGGGRPQIRSKHKRALTAAEIGTFLSILTETCNVSLAARETGRSARVFYDLKRRDSGFRAAWIEALRESYDHLELELVRRIRFGTPKDVFHQGKKTGTTRVFNDGMALRLLHHHRKSVEPLRAADSQGQRDAAAIFDELAARLAEIEAEKAAKNKEDDGGQA
jgi:integrase